MKQWLAGIVVTLALGGCQPLAAPRVSEVASQPGSPAVMQRLLVLGAGASVEDQRAMEQALARQLEGQGRQLWLGSRWFSGRPAPSLAQISARAQAEGATGILLTRLMRFEERAAPEPQSSFSLRVPERRAGARVGWEQEPGALLGGGEGAVAESKAILETRLYDAASGELLWQAQTQVLLEREAARGFPGFASAVAAQLERNGWL